MGVAAMDTTMSSSTEKALICMCEMGKGLSAGNWIAIAALVLLVIFAIIWLRRSRRTPPVMETPLLVLQRRLAAGEITAEQFDQLKVHLSSRVT